MDIVIFKDLTTNEAIAELKAEGEKYQGLYVDMNNAKERKYVKEKAQYIKDLKKQVDRMRIDAAKAYKAQVEKEAASIIEDLNINKAVYTLVITGEGEKFFSAGADLNVFADGDKGKASDMARVFGDAFETLRDFRGVSSS